jgi:hypothetical protein
MYLEEWLTGGLHTRRWLRAGSGDDQRVELGAVGPKRVEDGGGPGARTDRVEDGVEAGVGGAGGFEGSGVILRRPHETGARAEGPQVSVVGSGAGRDNGGRGQRDAEKLDGGSADAGTASKNQDGPGLVVGSVVGRESGDAHRKTDGEGGESSQVGDPGSLHVSIPTDQQWPFIG